MPGSQSIQGLVSNLDIDSMVAAIIAAEREPVTILEDDVTIKTAQVSAYQAISAKFLALQTYVTPLKKASSFNKTNITVSDDTVLTATAGSELKTGTYSLRVLSLAQNHQLASQGFDDYSTADFGTGNIEISVGSSSTTTIEIDSNNNSLTGIKDAINDANIGVTASILNDGSSSKPYRLILTSDETGSNNKISVDVSLSGGDTIDLTGASFDIPEETSFSSGSTSAVSLGSTAAYTGSKNKIYTFTVDGSGTKTIGSDNITINWSDGTNSGSILVTQADTEYELTGTGADGLKLSFSSGDLTGGDTFQVSTFAPLLQKGTDAKVAIGGDSSDGSSGIVVTSDSNTFKDLFPGITVSVKKVSESGTYETITSEINTSGIQQLITDFIDKYNDVIEFIDEQNTYDTENEDAGVLFADLSLQVMQSSLRSAATSVLDGLTQEFHSLSSIGIRSNSDGQLSVVDSSLLTEAIEENPEAFQKIFIDSGESSSTGIEFLSASSDTVAGENYDVNITQAATHGYLQGTAINNLSLSALTLTDSNNKIKLRVDGVVSNEITLSARTYNSGEELATELQTRINADSKIGSRDVTVEWVDLGDTGYLKLTGSTYGSSSKVEIMTSISNTAYNALGLSQGLSHYGRNVKGTINGEEATGSGQILTGKDGNKTTDGLKIKVTLTESEVDSGKEGTISIVRGLGSIMEKALDNITKSTDGSIARRVSALNKQIEQLNDQIADFDERLDAREEDLYTQFSNMEQAIQEYQDIASYLETQLESISNGYSLSSSNES